MKRIMLSSVIAILFLGGILIFTAFRNSVGESSDIIIVRTIEVPSIVGPSKIMVVDGSTTIRSGNLKPNIERNWESNVLQVHAVLESVKKQGYTLVSSNSSGETAIISNYIFEKK